MFRHSLPREVMLRELVVDRAKLEALPVDDPVGSVCVNVIDDVSSLPLGSKFASCLMSCNNWSS